MNVNEIRALKALSSLAVVIEFLKDNPKAAKDLVKAHADSEAIETQIKEANELLLQAKAKAADADKKLEKIKTADEMEGEYQKRLKSLADRVKRLNAERKEWEAEKSEAQSKLWAREEELKEAKEAADKAIKKANADLKKAKSIEAKALKLQGEYEEKLKKAQAFIEAA